MVHVLDYPECNWKGKGINMPPISNSFNILGLLNIIPDILPRDFEFIQFTLDGQQCPHISNQPLLSVGKGTGRVFFSRGGGKLVPSVKFGRTAAFGEVISIFIHILERIKVVSTVSTSRW